MHKIVSRGLLFGLLAFVTLASSFSSATIESTGVGGGTLSWPVTSTSGNCGYEGQSQYTQWNLGPFTFVVGGNTYPLGGSAAYITSPGGSNCPVPGPEPATGEVLQGSDYTITLTAESGGYGSAVYNATGVFYPAYQVTSIIYAAPGNKGQNGYSDTTTDGATYTVGGTFTYGESITFTEGFTALGVGGSASESFGASVTLSNSNAFQETFTDATGVTLNSLATDPDAVNHNLDYFLIWLDPQVTVSGDPPTPSSYSVSIAPTANGETPLPDIIGQNAITMEANAAGMTTIDPTWLNQQYNPATGQYTPGLAAICKDLKTAEYNAGTCTKTDQCGCTPTDFAPILAQDPLLFYQGSKTINPYPGYANPLAANVSTTCGTIPEPTGTNCRYVPVPSAPGSTTQETLTLSGPDCTWCGSPSWPFQQGENQSKTITYGFTTEEDVSYSLKAGSSDAFSVTETDTWKWTQSESEGTTAGTGVTQTVTLSSATAGCGQDISVFEDTVYHTFLFMQPGPTGSQAASCSTATVTPTFSPAAGTYTTEQTVTISTSSTGAPIYYTTNGTTPTTSSTLYTAPITVSTTETVKAISAIPGWTASAVGSAAYTIE
jgi:hypothetical protein